MSKHNEYMYTFVLISACILYTFLLDLTAILNRKCCRIDLWYSGIKKNLYSAILSQGVSLSVDCKIPMM